jgi:S-layer protein
MLTTGVDTGALFTGGAGNDTFNAAVGGNTTLQATDKLVGGLGTDTLNITIDGNTTATTSGADISGIEVINVRNVGSGVAALDAATTPGVTAVNADRGTGALDVTNLVAGATFSAVGNGFVTLGALGVGYAAGATAATINVSGGTVSTGTITQTGTGLLSTTINSTGAANTVGAVVMAASETGALTINATTALKTGAITQTTAAATSVVVTGAGAVDISAGVLMTTVKLVDASTNTGGLKVITGNTAAGDATTAGLTVKGTSAADTINIAASDAANFVTVNASSGADLVKVLSATQFAITNNYTVTGNSAATLQVDFADTAGTQNADLSAKYVGFGTLEVISNGTAARVETLAMDINKLAISNFVYSGDAADSLVITGAAAASTVTIKTNANAVTASIGTETAADVLNVVLDGTTLAGALTATGNGTTGYDTLNITSQKDTALNTNSITGVTASSASKVNISGAADFATGTITTKAAGTVDASAMTAGTLTATLTSATTTFKGGAGVDALTLGAGTLAQGFSYDGGTGDNTIAVTATAAQNAGILVLTNFKTVAVTTATTGVDTTTFDLRNVTNVSNFTFASGTTSDNLTLNNVKSGQVLTLTGTTAFDAVSLTANSGTTQALAFGSSLAVATLNVDAAATAVTLSEVTTKTATITNAIAGGSLTTVNLTGAGSFAIGAQSSTVTTIDGSALSDGTLTATLGTAGTLKGGAGGDALTGSSGIDIINGGAGADTITTGGGRDTLTGGDTNAVDTFVISGVAAGTATSQITITDFATVAANTANAAIIADVLAFKDAGVNIAGTAVVAVAATSLAAAASLVDALNLLAAGDGSTNAAIKFGVFGGDTYVVVDNTAGATLEATDFVVKLTGVTNLTAAEITVI